MARKSKDFLNKLKKKYSVDRLWSWSRINCYRNSQYEYYLKYILKEKEDRKDGIYAIQGGICHDIIENFYLKNIEFTDMITQYENKLFELELAEYKYDRTDDEKNKNIAYNYENSIRDFFKTHNIIKHKVMLEQFITIKVGNNLFQGYIDCLVRDKDDNIHILDWKTSTIYTGEKAEKESGQLMLYAIGLLQQGVPLNKIKIGWNFLKYRTVTYIQKNGNKKSMNILRVENWMKKPTVYKNIISNAEKLNLDLEKINKSIELYEFENLPEELKNLHSVEDCYVYVELTQEKLEKFQSKLIETIQEIKYKELDCDENSFIDEVTDKNSYYFYNLCGYSRDKHKPFDNYLTNIEMFMDE